MVGAGYWLQRWASALSEDRNADVCIRRDTPTVSIRAGCQRSARITTCLSREGADLEVSLNMRQRTSFRVKCAEPRPPYLFSQFSVL